MNRRVTIKDVAQRAGVSWKTVSNVVHQREYVADATRQRVQAAIDELGYIPNTIGRDLRGGSTHTIALVVPTLTNPYFAHLAESLQVAARSAGWSVAVEVSLGDREAERRHAWGRTPRPVDAVVISPVCLRAQDVADRPSGPRMVLLGEALDAQPGIVHIAIDNVGSAVDLTQHLLTSGRRRIAFLGADSSIPSTGRARLLGMRAAVRALHEEQDPALIRTLPEWTAEAGYNAMSALLDEGISFDAVIGGNDLIALGACAALRSAGKQIGGGSDAIAVAGWDDIPEVSRSLPPLTTIAPDVPHLTRAVLNAVTDTDVPEGAEVVIPHRLVVRDSTSAG